MSDLLAIAVMASLIFAVLFLAVYLLSDKFRMFIKKSIAIDFKNKLVSKEEYNQALLCFTEATGITKTSVSTIWSLTLAERLIELLERTYGGTLEYLSKVCVINSKSCSTIIKIVTESGNTILLNFNWDPADTKTSKGRKVFQSDFLNVEDYADKNGRISQCNSVDIIYSSTLTEDSQDILNILDLIKQSKLEFIKYEEVGVFTRLYNIVANTNGVYNLAPFMRTIIESTPEYLDLAYNKVKIKFGGEEVELPMSDALDFAVDGLLLPYPENLYICGETGTGKTELSQQLSLRLAEREDVRVVTLTAGLVRGLASSAGQAQLQALLSDGSEKRTVIIIDEAETTMQENEVHSLDNSFLLQLTSGTLQKDLNCACVLIFNARPEKLNAKLFRAGRMGMWMDLTPIPALQASKLVTYLRESMTDKVFDDRNYQQILTNINNLFGGSGKMYAAAGEITLADVYSCFVDRDHRALLVDRLRKAAGLEPLLTKRAPAAKVEPETKVEVELKAEVGGGRRRIAALADNSGAASTIGTAEKPPAPTIQGHKKHRKRKRK